MAIEFHEGKYYHSQHGIFLVLKAKPFPIIEPQLYPKCRTSYFANHMLAEHNKLVQKISLKLEEANKFEISYKAPSLSARDEIEELTKDYNTAIETRHRKFLKDKGISYPGTKKPGKRKRATNCYSCKKHLDNDIDKECRACGWIICFCGACGCGYARGT